ncbi:MAG: hypothetical protein HUU43_15540 [Ignavibacteriaceae bacterium]|nr:hypothetical protein [Ignavibacteriaceae bacterium]
MKNAKIEILSDIKTAGIILLATLTVIAPCIVLFWALFEPAWYTIILSWVCLFVLMRAFGNARIEIRNIEMEDPGSEYWRNN